MSHPDSKHDPENEYPRDSVPMERALGKKMGKKYKGPKGSISHKINELKDKPGESPLAKLKRLTS